VPLTTVLSLEHRYIATQGPLKHTADDFWLMISQCKVSVIAMLTHDEEDSYQYWPNEGAGTVAYGAVTVTADKVP
jgi:receptor-type tyrosine-protein phosphatase zeta